MTLQRSFMAHQCPMLLQCICRKVVGSASTAQTLRCSSKAASAQLCLAICLCQSSLLRPWLPSCRQRSQRPGACPTLETQIEQLLYTVTSCFHTAHTYLSNSGDLLPQKHHDLDKGRALGLPAQAVSLSIWEGRLGQVRGEKFQSSLYSDQAAHLQLEPRLNLTGPVMLVDMHKSAALGSSRGGHYAENNMYQLSL